MMVVMTLSCLEGDWIAGREHCDRGLEITPIQPAILGTRVLLEYQTGEFDEGEFYLERLLRTSSIRASARSCIALATIARITGSSDRLDIASAIAEEVLSDQSVNPNVGVGARAALALLYVHKGDQSKAEEHYAYFLGHRGTMMWSQSSVDRLLGLLSQTIGDLDQAAEHFEDAVGFCRKAGYRPELAWSCCDYSDMLRVRNAEGDRSKAIALLDESLAISSELGMRPLMERVLARKLEFQGVASVDIRTSIDHVAAAVQTEQPDLRSHAAPDGTVTILFSDIEGSTQMTERLGDQRMQQVLRDHNDIVRHQVAAYDGFEVKSLGDGFMLAFSSARRALQCAMAIQRAFAAHNHEHSEEPVRVRMGLHTGEFVQEMDDFFGKNVILASRIADRAHGGEILVSSLLKELTDSAGDIQFGEGQEMELKGLSGLNRVYLVDWT